MKNLHSLTRCLTLLVAGAGLAACTPGGDDDPDDPDDPDACPLWYDDADGDNYGDSSDPGQRRCIDPGDGYVRNNLDCDDTRRWVNPFEPEACDGIDNNCDGEIEIDCPAGCYPFSLDVVGQDGVKDYMFCSAPRTFDAARTTCQQEGYDLVHFNSAAEHHAVLHHEQIFLLYGRVWIGATDQGEEGVWRWIDDSAQLWSGTWAGIHPDLQTAGTGVGFAGVFQAWEPNRSPDNGAYFGQPEEDCATVVAYSAQWQDTDCAREYPSICERIAVSP